MTPNVNGYDLVVLSITCKKSSAIAEASAKYKIK